MKMRVGVVGYGTIGKRVSDAVMLQDDMTLAGVTGNSYSYRMEIAHSRNIPVFAIGDPGQFRKNGIEPAGGMEELMEDSDIIIDCTPKKIGRMNKENFYQKKGIKAIFQGGEKADVADVSFCAQANYDEAIDKDYIRVVSCNTTGLTRTLDTLDKAFGVKKARATLIRRAGDPHAVDRGPINAIVPSLELPSHHGPDVRTVLHNMEVFTTSVVVPTTLMHMHSLSVVLEKAHEIPEVVEAFRNSTRIRMVKGAHELSSTAEVMEMARDLGNKRGDMMEVCVWEEGIGKYDGELFFPQAIHQESIVVPENIDAVRAALDMCSGQKSINKTNQSLSIK